MLTRAVSLASFLAVVQPGLAVEAAVCTWTGGGFDAQWSTAANWNNCGGEHPVPQDGDEVVFPAGAARSFALNDIPGVNLAALAIDGLAAGNQRYVISGGAIGMAGLLTFASPPEPSTTMPGPIIFNELALNGPTVISQSGGVGPAVVYGTIALNGHALTLGVGAPGTLTLNGTIGGAGGLSKTGAGDAVLASANSYARRADEHPGRPPDRGEQHRAWVRRRRRRDDRRRRRRAADPRRWRREHALRSHRAPRHARQCESAGRGRFGRPDWQSARGRNAADDNRRHHHRDGIADQTGRWNARAGRAELLHGPDDRRARNASRQRHAAQ